MARKSKAAEAVVEEAAQEAAQESLAALDTPVDSDLFESAEDVLNAEPEMGMYDPAWSDFVLSHFQEDELGDGKPKVNGLRRVAQQLLGPILQAVPTTVQSPSFIPNGKQAGVGDWEPAVVEFSVTFLWTRDDERKGREVTFADVGSLWEKNCDNDVVRRYQAEVAATRAEARALRKALMLRGIAYEEAGAGAGPQEDDRVSPQMVLVIEHNCKKLDIDLEGFVNGGRRKYAAVQDVPKDTGHKMIEVLGEYDRDRGRIPQGLEGFKSDWRKSFSR